MQKRLELHAPLNLSGWGFRETPGTNQCFYKCMYVSYLRNKGLLDCDRFKSRLDTIVASFSRQFCCQVVAPLGCRRTIFRFLIHAFVASCIPYHLAGRRTGAPLRPSLHPAGMVPHLVHHARKQCLRVRPRHERGCAPTALLVLGRRLPRWACRAHGPEVPMLTVQTLK